MRLTIGPGAMAIVLVGIGLGLLAFAGANAAHKVLGWAVASAVVAALIEPIVAFLDRFIPRVFAMLITIIGVAAVAGLIAFGVMSDLGNQVSRLKTSAPEAAARLEESPRFGSLAKDLSLHDRVQEVVANLEQPSSGAAGWAASSAGTFFVCGILVAFLISWGPRYARSAFDQIRDPNRRIRVAAIAQLAFRRARRYVLGNLALALVAGLALWGICRLEQVPGSLAIGLAGAALSIIPGVGIALGAVPALLLEAGLGDAAGEIRLALAVLALQALHTTVMHLLVTPRSLVVGPAPIVITFVLGFEVYGIGGAYYATFMAILAVALLDAASLSRQLLAAPDATAKERLL
jgi:predicted PurR-regulated permease PerM